MRRYRLLAGWQLAILATVSASTSVAQQIIDPAFKVSVEHPAYVKTGPTVAIDAAHSNSHTADGQYKPFAELLRADGYKVVALEKIFAAETLTGIDVLVIANAKARDMTIPAFTEQECDAVRDWVRRGGALLLIADHAPFGTSAANMAARFGVTMGQGWVFDYPSADTLTTQLVFSRENGLLGQHPILNGRASSEAINLVKTFAGQSLAVPQGAVGLLKFSKNAREAASAADLDAEAIATAKNDGEDGTHSASVSGRAQGLALDLDKGRVVVLGDAALLSAQLATAKDGKAQERPVKIGMNAPGSDDRQFALNVLHWLSRLLN